MPNRTFTFENFTEPMTWEDINLGQFFTHEACRDVVFFMDRVGVIVVVNNDPEFDFDPGCGTLATDEADFMHCTGDAQKYFDDDLGCHTGFILLDPVKFEFIERA